MDANRAILALVLICSLIQSASLEKSQPIQTETGGGDCIDNDDCANNGICRIEKTSTEKGKCNCFVGFTKPNCDAESKVKKLEPGVKGKAVRRNHIHRHESASKRYETGSGSYESASKSDETGSERNLEYDPASDIFGLTPKNLADSGQEFLIYNPDKKVFLFVSKDIKATGKRMPYIEARGDRAGLRNIFTFMKVPGQDGKYYIKNKDTNKFLYVSKSKSGFIKYWNNNVLAADSVATDDSKTKYIFEFVDEDGDGFYEIKNQGKTFYVSSHMLGIPMHRLVKATDQKELERWNSQFFQFVLKDKAKAVKFATKGEPRKRLQTVIDAGQSSKSCNKGKSKTDKEDDPKSKAIPF
eukprot:Seg1095.15 transcript_id=Seg1095.15/GoldUCD/mRNA.D3Y31 product="hypothetical protein" protein_id=Seg1095.15/GoldUCD/D3Y31